jgi:beta-N-acetylhexosaminidase
MTTVAIALIGVLALAGCGGLHEKGGESASPTPTRTAAAPTPTPTPTVDPIAGMTLAQKVGQLFMAGTAATAADPALVADVERGELGGIFLHGRSSAGVQATATVVAAFTSRLPAGSPRMWVATDQEGGDVQVLSGPGFDRIPTALTQAQQGAQLRASATDWGRELAAAGVNVNLAPVADIVTSPQTAPSNSPIGAMSRQYGYSESAVAAGAGAFAAGMRAAGVLPTFKHFPGLGHVGPNTDTSSGVTDTVVGPTSPDVDVYRGLTAAGPSLVMVSTAVYQRIDPSAPAAFSPAVLSLLRTQVGFEGVVITDDLSAAAQVQAWSPGDRAVLAIAAGVDVVLVSSNPSVLPAMVQAVTAKAQADPGFAQVVDAAARRVVEAKAATR